MEFKLPLLCLSADRFGERWGKDKQKNYFIFLIGITNTLGRSLGTGPNKLTLKNYIKSV
jgi:hypothetical protein